MKEVLVDHYSKKIKEWLKKNEESSEIKAVQSLLEKDAENAKQLRMVSHNPKVTHTSIKKHIGSILPKKESKNDGLLRSGNCTLFHVDSIEKMDCIGNAAALGSYSLLDLKMPDNKTFYWHLQKETADIKKLLRHYDVNFEDFKSNYWLIFKKPEEVSTSGLLKQVYFPVDNSYHLLSIITPATIVFELRKRIDELRFSADVAASRTAKKNNQPGKNYKELSSLALLTIGGTKAQNAGALMNKIKGKSLLFKSIPPKLEKRKIRLPKRDFFKTSLYKKSFKDAFQKLHDLFLCKINNMHIRKGRDNCINVILEKILFKAHAIRNRETGWTQNEMYKNLPQNQKFWLDDYHADAKQASSNWRDEISSQIASWIIRTYDMLFKHEAVILSDSELAYIKRTIESNKEYF